MLMRESREPSRLLFRRTQCYIMEMVMMSVMIGVQNSVWKKVPRRREFPPSVMVNVRVTTTATGRLTSMKTLAILSERRKCPLSNRVTHRLSLMKPMPNGACRLWDATLANDTVTEETRGTSTNM